MGSGSASMQLRLSAPPRSAGSSGGGTSGIGTGARSPSSAYGTSTHMEKIAWPCWIATTRRVVKLPPSRMRSTS